MKFTHFIFLFLLFFYGCNLVEEDKPDLIIQGMKPVYGDNSKIKHITIGDTIPIQSPGRIVYLSPYLFVNEIGKGIHVINNTDPENPMKEAFIDIPFNQDLAVQNNIIYVDNDKDLVSLKYISSDSITLLSREPDVFDRVSLLPQDYNGYFECVDESKGEVIGWVTAELTNPKCRTF